MELFGNEIDLYFIFINSLILIDTVLITIAMIFMIPEDVAFAIQLFDFIVCLLLILDWVINLYNSSPMICYLKSKENILGLIASIPFDALLPVVIPGINILRYLRLLKLVRILLMFNKFYDGIKVFFDKTNMHKIIGVALLIIAIFTFILWVFGPSYGQFDDFYFVVVTLTTVGYGDVTPKTYNEKVLTIILILIGIFMFSTITAAISSFLTDRLVNTDDELENVIDMVRESSENIMDELENIRNENTELKNEISQLKNEVNELKDVIKK